MSEKPSNIVYVDFTNKGKYTKQLDSIYSLLRKLNDPDSFILSAEDIIRFRKQDNEE